MKYAGILAALAALVLQGCATSSPTGVQVGRASNSLSTFQGDADFRDYLRGLRREARRSRQWWAQTTHSYGANTSDDEAIVVTGTRLVRQDFEAVSPVTEVESGSITNNQERNVDEGDIVKRIGDFLIVLQDGRLFTVDIRSRHAPELAVVSRTDVYRNAADESWIDEMLVFGRRIVVTGYSYVIGAAEYSIFSLGEDGSLTREGVYYISSGDYYDAENYATRIIGDNLVFYTPIQLPSINPDQPFDWPSARRWIGEDANGQHFSNGRPLFRARDIYQPLGRLLRPTLHAITVCPLGNVRSSEDLGCHTTAVLGGSGREFYVTTDSVYLWTFNSSWEDESGCDAHRQGVDAGVAATLYRIPISGAPPMAIGTHGAPINQFSFAAVGGEFHALLREDCGEDGGKLTLAHFHAPLSAFAGVPRRMDASHFDALPTFGDENTDYENRFTDRYLIYASRASWGNEPPDTPLTAPQHVVAVPLARPAAHTTLAVPYGVIRLERVDEDIFLDGYHDRSGLDLSMLDLSGAPRVLAPTHLENRYESEGRSHAFNALSRTGSTLVGLPTVGPGEGSSRYPWESQDSDVSFLTLDGAGQFSVLGHLRHTPNAVDATYKCEVSCVDWYGNARPIFTDGRIFALTGSELVEGAVAHGTIRELRRVNLTAPQQRAASR